MAHIKSDDLYSRVSAELPDKWKSIETYCVGLFGGGKTYKERRDANDSHPDSMLAAQFRVSWRRSMRLHGVNPEQFGL